MTSARRLPLLALALTCGAAPLPPDLQGRILAAHNAARAEVGVPPMRWDPALAAEAGRWAEHLASTGRLAHAEDRGGAGENLWMGTRGAFTVEAMVGTWAAEKPAFRRAARWENDFPHVGHYTQMVWRGTTAVGCGLAGQGANDILVCRYRPAGNLLGQRPY